MIGAFLRRDARVALSYRAPFVLEVLSALFILFTFSLLGRLVPPERVPGGYFSFVAAGLGLTAFLQAGVSVLAANFRQEQVQGTLEALLSTGLSAPRLAAGMATYPMVAAAVRVVVYAVLAGALGASTDHPNWSLAVTGIALGAVSFAGMGMAAAALVVTIRQAAGAVAFLVSLLGLAGGALVPTSELPGWARWLGELSPLTHALDVTRGALFERASWSDAGGDIGALVLLAALALLVGVAALGLALGLARRRGGIGDY
ncbi:MAG: ABC transporter permease [Actinobacteria bacterium]|nr:ABC transporter permease [Actinomycetota bacterium]